MDIQTVASRSYFGLLTPFLSATFGCVLHVVSLVHFFYACFLCNSPFSRKTIYTVFYTETQNNRVFPLRCFTHSSPDRRVSTNRTFYAETPLCKLSRCLYAAKPFHRQVSSLPEYKEVVKHKGIDRKHF